MTTIVWPPQLPKVLRLEGLSAKRNGAVVRTEMDAGPAKARRRYTVSTKDFTGSVLLSCEQREILEAWYTQTLAEGVLRFAMQDPQTLEISEFRFKESYNEESLDGLWQISMTLEKMNE